MMDMVLAIDPGRMKCGVAVVKSSGEVVFQDVIDTPHLDLLVRELGREHRPNVIVIGNGTGSAPVIETLRALDIAPVETIDEKYTSELARKRFFIENPPKGLRKLIPTSIQNPPRPFDDYVAVILAENYIAKSSL